MHAIPFDERELSNITSMATLMLVAGAITILSGLLGIASSILTLVLAPDGTDAQAAGGVCGSVVAMLAYAALGVWLIVGGIAFRRVVASDDADQANLVSGLRQLRNVFLLKSILIILAIVLACVAIVVGMLFGAAALGSGGGGF